MVEERKGHPYHIHDSMRSVGTLMRECLAGNCHESRRDLVYLVQEAKINRVYCVGTGSSYLAAIAEAFAVRELVGLPAEAWNSTEMRLYSPESLGPGSLLLMNSHSGKSPGDIGTVRLARDRGAFTVAVTDIFPTGLTDAVDFILLGPGGPKFEMPSTRTYSLAMYRVFLFLCNWSERLGRSTKTGDCAAELQVMPDMCDEVVERYDSLGRHLAMQIKDAGSYLVVAHGPNLSTAQEGAMGLAQASGRPSQGFLLEEYLHGHIQGLADHVSMTIIGSPGPSQKRLVSFSQVAESLGMSVMTLVPETDAGLVGTGGILPIPGEIREIFTPVVACIPFWFMGYWLTLLNGRDPDMLLMKDPMFTASGIAQYKKDYA